MKSRVSAVALAAVLIAYPVVGAESVSTTTNQEVSAGQQQNQQPDLDQQVADLQARLAALESAGNNAPACTCYDPCRRAPGLVGGAELTFLKPHESGGLTPYYYYTAQSASFFDLEPAPRVWLGFSGSGGLGIRARWWEFDHGASTSSFYQDYGNMDSTIGLDLSVLDLEATLASRIGCSWDALLSAGVRRVEYEMTDRTEFEQGTTQDYSDTNVFYGTGLTVAAELRRRLLGSFHLFGNVRGSAVYGDGRRSYVYHSDTDDSAYSYAEPDSMGYIWETQMGLEFVRPLGRGGQIFVRGAAEAQQWDDFADRGLSSLGLIGGTVSAGIAR